jgi:hypothetical protein
LEDDLAAGCWIVEDIHSKETEIHT